MLMNGINGLVTIAKYWKQWTDPRLIVMVLANRDLNQVTWEQRVMNGDPKYDTSQDVPEFHFARYAEMLGITGIRVDKPEQVGPAWDQALSARQPVVIEAYTDPEVPTLPPHIDFKQAKGFMLSTLPDTDTMGIIKGSLLEMAQSVLPHKS